MLSTGAHLKMLPWSLPWLSMAAKEKIISDDPDPYISVVWAEALKKITPLRKMRKMNFFMK